MADPTEVYINGKGVLARLYWMFFGNLILVFLLIFIFEKGPGFPSLHDAAYLVTLVSLLIIRYLDIRFLKGETGEGKPATMTDWRHHAVLVSSVATGAWIVARATGHFLR
jgi:hypothetical protein